MNFILSRYKNDNTAATSIEYGLIAGGISLAIVTIIFVFGESLIETYNFMVSDMADVNDRIGG